MAHFMSPKYSAAILIRQPVDILERWLQMFISTLCFMKLRSTSQLGMEGHGEMWGSHQGQPMRAERGLHLLRYKGCT